MSKFCRDSVTTKKINFFAFLTEILPFVIIHWFLFWALHIDRKPSCKKIHLYHRNMKTRSPFRFLKSAMRPWVPWYSSSVAMQPLRWNLLQLFIRPKSRSYIHIRVKCYICIQNWHRSNELQPTKVWVSDKHRRLMIELRHPYNV